MAHGTRHHTSGGSGGSGTSGTTHGADHPRQPAAPAPGHGTGPAPHVGDPRQIRTGARTPAENAEDGGNGGNGGSGETGGEDAAPVDPRQSWFSGALKEAGTGAAGSLGGRAGDYVGEKLFGSGEEPEGTDRPGGPGESAGPEGVGTLPAPSPGYAGGGIGGIGGAAGASTLPGYGLPGAPGGPADAYAWARAQIERTFQELPEAEHESRGGLGGALDEAVEWALEESGLLDMLEKVTGNLAELNDATAQWQAQAAAVHSVAAELRSGAVPVAASWQGAASDAFGGHMGDVADALDRTAEEMLQTAQIINSAAQECAMAEGMVIQIITEAIEALIASLAAEAVLSVVTFGAAALVGALIDEAEIATFVARVAQVSTKLAKALEELLKALQEMGEAVKATRRLGDVAKVVEKMKKVETAFNEVRKLEEGTGKAARIARKLDEKATEKVGDWAQDRIKAGLGIDEDDREGVRIGDGTLKGGLRAAGQSALGVAKEGLKSDVDKNAVERELLGDLGLEQQPTPYRVDRSRIQTAFG
ncbi:type VII secretion system (Wss) protein ESAT-6 [Kitasatospora sp. SolWspMP-SS2h]|uniref:WXG100 family type VII secretion target n=1 Tax=Kitasatospora sp. SolWspMP-SS2h TaxID=1305729 RepID=UPI000DB981A4|nr:WXG100 family type VII secretion target [Kitasatospora sp. SolWspMP-SS2h]RAJ43699.1 type VII secretion system (Wss) protein ESAT-6 [Kitasatospora sp. SolWspMP-SS2h]